MFLADLTAKKMTRIDAQTEIHVVADHPGSRDETSDPESENGDQQLHENDEFKLPPTPSLAIIIISNVLLQVCLTPRRPMNGEYLYDACL